MTGRREDDPAVADEARLIAVRDEIRFELGLLHDRVNALLSAEAFLTIAYTAAMSNGAAWGRHFAAIAAPVLAVLDLLLALLALPGVTATTRIVLAQTARQEELVERLPGSALGGFHSATGRGSALKDQHRSLLFFRTVPLLHCGRRRRRGCRAASGTTSTMYTNGTSNADSSAGATRCMVLLTQTMKSAPAACKRIARSVR